MVSQKGASLDDQKAAGEVASLHSFSSTDELEEGQGMAHPREKPCGGLKDSKSSRGQVLGNDEWVTPVSINE
jgi:hypothetical protein